MKTQQPINKVLKGRKQRYQEEMHKAFGESWRTVSRQKGIYNIPEPQHQRIINY